MEGPNKMTQTTIEHFVTILLSEPNDNNSVLLLERGQDRQIFPGLWTGVGGALEIIDGQLESVEQCSLREIKEETGYHSTEILNLRLRLVTPRIENGLVTLIHWMTGCVQEKRTPVCPEGTLHWVPTSELTNRPFIPSAAVVIPWLVQLTVADTTVYEGMFQRAEGAISELLVSPSV